MFWRKFIFKKYQLWHFFRWDSRKYAQFWLIYRKNAENRISFEIHLATCITIGSLTFGLKYPWVFWTSAETFLHFFADRKNPIWINSAGPHIDSSQFVMPASKSAGQNKRGKKLRNQSRPIFSGEVFNLTAEDSLDEDGEFFYSNHSKQVWPLTQFFSVSFFLLMAPGRGNTILFRSCQQLPRLRLGPLKGFLSWHGALQGPSTRLLRCFQNYGDTRTPSGVRR